MKLTQDQKMNLGSCYSHHKGVFPKELEVSGVMFWRGQRITKADFRAVKRDGLEADRFNK